MLEVIILAGGLGTRLRSKVPDLPKALVPINGKPFLEVMIRELEKHSQVTKLIFALGYKSESIQNFLQNFESRLSIELSIEDKPLGTGGAIRKALELVEGDTFLAMNGDSFIPFSVEDFLAFHQKAEANVSILSTEVEDSSRFGALKIEESTNRVLAFEEKGKTESKRINAGIYLLKKHLFSNYPPEKEFSIEKDFFPPLCGGKMYSYLVKAPFIDIGTPLSFDEAQHFFQEINT